MEEVVAYNNFFGEEDDTKGVVQESTVSDSLSWWEKGLRKVRVTKQNQAALTCCGLFGFSS